MKYFTLKVWLYPLCWVMIRNIYGKENIPNKAPFIVVSNHDERIDSLYLFYTILSKLNKKVHFIATPTYWFLGERIFRDWAGCIPLFNPKQAYKEAMKLIKDGEIVGIYPEGRFELKNRTKNPKTGAVRLALESKIPILPIGIKTSYIPLKSAVKIGNLFYPDKKKSIKRQTRDLMEHIYSLKNKNNKD